MTKGEKALVFSLNTRWLPDFIDLKQRARMNSIYFKFGPTQHDSLAQQPGINTYFIDDKKIMWKVIGKKESGKGSAGSLITRETQDFPESSGTFLEIKDSILIPLVSFSGKPITKGNYRLSFKYSDNPEDVSLMLIDKNDQIQIKADEKETGTGITVIHANIKIDGEKKYFLKVLTKKETIKISNLVISPL
jgi:hypothetical protein